MFGPNVAAFVRLGPGPRRTFAEACRVFTSVECTFRRFGGVLAELYLVYLVLPGVLDAAIIRLTSSL
jgi:hypothetical protein